MRKSIQFPIFPILPSTLLPPKIPVFFPGEIFLSNLASLPVRLVLVSAVHADGNTHIIANYTILIYTVIQCKNKNNLLFITQKWSSYNHKSWGTSSIEERSLRRHCVVTWARFQRLKIRISGCGIKPRHKIAIGQAEIWIYGLPKHETRVTNTRPRRWKNITLYLVWQRCQGNRLSQIEYSNACPESNRFSRIYSDYVLICINSVSMTFDHCMQIHEASFITCQHLTNCFIHFGEINVFLTSTDIWSYCCRVSWWYSVPQDTSHFYFSPISVFLSRQLPSISLQNYLYSPRRTDVINESVIRVHFNSWDISWFERQPFVLKNWSVSFLFKRENYAFCVK